MSKVAVARNVNETSGTLPKAGLSELTDEQLDEVSGGRIPNPPHVRPSPSPTQAA